MAGEGLDVNGAPLKFVAQIEDDDFDKGADNMINKLRQVGEASKNSFGIAINAQREYQNMLLNSGGAFDKLDENTKRQLATLTSLQKSFVEVSQAKEVLNTSFNQGNISQATYQASLAKLVEDEKALAVAMSEASNQLAKSESFQKTANTTLANRTAEIGRLEAAYNSLSTAQKATTHGVAMSDNLEKAKQDLNGLQQALKALNNNALGNLNTELQDVDTNIGKLKLSFGTMPKLTVEGIDESAAKLQRLRAIFDRMDEEKKLSIIGQGVLEDITELEKHLGRVDNILENLPALTLGEIDSKKAQLASLTAELQKLSGSGNVDVNISGKISEQISRLNAEIDVLENNLKALPELSVGDIQAQIKHINQLTRQFQKLNEVDQLNPEVGGRIQADIQKANVVLDRFKSSLGNMPELAIKGIAERTAQIEKLQAAYRELDAVEPDALELKGNILKDVERLTSEIGGLKNTLASVPELTLGAIADKTVQVQKLKAQLEALPDSDNIDINLTGEITAKISALNASISTLKANVKNVPEIVLQVQGEQELQVLISKLNEAKAKLEALPESEQLDLSISGNLKQDVAQLDTQIARVVEKILNLPPLSLGNVEAEINRLRQLQTILDTLTDEEIGAGKADELKKDITETENRIKLLQAAIKAVPELTLGNLGEKVEDLVQLKNTIAAIRPPQNFVLDFGALPQKLKQLEALKQQLASLPDGKNIDLLVNIGTLETEIAAIRKSLTDLPPVSVEGVEETTAKIQALEKESARLKEQLAGLSTSEQIDISISGPIQNDINAIESEISDLKNSLATMPELSLGNIDELTRELENLQQQYQNLNKEQQNDPEVGGKMLASIRNLEDELEKLGVKLKGLPELKIGSIDERTAEIQKLSAAIKALPEIELNDPKIGGSMISDLQKMEQELDQLNAKIKSTPEFKFGSIAGKTAELSRLKNEYAELSAIDRRNATVGVQMKKNIQELEKEVKDLNGSFSETETFARKALVAAGAYLSIQGASDLFTQLKNVRGEFESLEIALTTILGSKAEANKLLAQVADLAAQSPYDLKEIGQGAKSLIAYGVAAEDAVKTLEMIGNVASGVSIPITELVQTYGKLRTQGRAYQEDINEFTGRGIPIIKELAKQFGVAESEIKNLVEAGKVGFPEVQKAFENMSGPGGQFNNLMAEQAKGIVGLSSGISDAFDRMFNSIGKNNEGIIKQGLSGTIELIDNYQQVLDIIQTLIIGYGAYRAAVVLQAAATSGLTAAEILHVQALTISTAAQRAYTAALALAPVAAFTAVIGALGLALYSMAQATSAAEASQERLNNIRDEGDLAANKEKERINSLISVIKSETATREQKAATVKKLRDSTGELLKGYSDEEIAAGRAAEAIKKYIAELERKAEVKVAFDELEKLNEQLGLLEVKGIKAIGFMDRLAQSLKNTFAPSGLSFSDYVKGLFSGDAANQKIVDQQKASLKNQRADLKKAYDFTEFFTGVANDTKDGGKSIADAFAELLKNVPLYFDTLLAMAKDRGQLEAIQKAVQEKINSLAPGSKEIAGLQARLAQVNKVLEQYDLKNDSKALKKSNDERLRFLEELSKKESEIRRKSLSDNDAELAEVRERYNLMRQEAAKLKLGPAIITRINRLEKTETGNVEYEQETERLQKEVNKQKEIFAAYESYKTAVGKEQADERFANEKANFANFGQLLENEIGKITALNIPVADMTEPMRERFLALKELQKEYNQQQRVAQDEIFLEAYQNTVSYEEEKFRIQERYAKQAAALVQAKPADLQARLQELDKLAALEIDAAKDTAFQKTAIYKQLSQEIIRFTRDEVLQQIEATKAALENVKNLTPELRATLERDLKDLEIKIKVGVDKAYLNDLQLQKKRLQESLGTQKLSTAETIKQRSELAKVIKLINEAKAEPFNKIADALSNISGSLNEAADLISTFDEKAGKAVNTIANLASSAASVFKGVAVGDPFAVLSGSIGLLKGFTDLMDNSDEKRAKYEAKQAASLERTKSVLAEMNRLLAAQAGIIEKALGVDKIAAFNRQLSLINADLVSTIKKINALEFTVKNANGRGVTKVTADLKNLFDLITTGGTRPRGNDPVTGVTTQLKTLEEVIEANKKRIDELYAGIANGSITGNVEELRTLLQTYEELGVQLDEYKNKLREVITGTTFDSIVDSIADGFRKGFANATEQAKFFADAFQDLMRNAIIESLKREALEKPLKEFYEEFARNSADGLSAEEVQNLQDIYNQIIKDAQAKYEQLKEIAGVSFNSTDSGGPNKNTLSGAFATASQESIDLLSGQFGGLRITSIEQLEVLRQMLAALLAPGAVNVPGAGNGTFSVPGVLEIQANTAQSVTLQQQTVLIGREQVQLMTRALDYQRRTADSNDQIELNTRRLQGVEATLKDISRKIGANADALKANGGG